MLVYDTFLRFPDFPKEIQLLVWEQALPYIQGHTKRVIRVIWQEYPLATLIVSRTSYATYSTSSEVFDLAMTLACKACRNVYLKAFPHTLAQPFQVRSRNKYCQQRVGILHYDDHTAFYIEDFSGYILRNRPDWYHLVAHLPSDQLSMLLPTNRIKSLIFDFSEYSLPLGVDPKRGCSVWILAVNFLAKKFGNLESVLVVIRKLKLLKNDQFRDKVVLALMRYFELAFEVHRGTRPLKTPTLEFIVEQYGRD